MSILLIEFKFPHPGSTFPQRISNCVHNLPLNIFQTLFILARATSFLWLRYILTLILYFAKVTLSLCSLSEIENREFITHYPALLMVYKHAGSCRLFCSVVSAAAFILFTFDHQTIFIEITTTFPLVTSSNILFLLLYSSSCLQKKELSFDPSSFSFNRING